MTIGRPPLGIRFATFFVPSDGLTPMRCVDVKFLASSWSKSHHAGAGFSPAGEPAEACRNPAIRWNKTGVADSSGIVPRANSYSWRH